MVLKKTSAVVTKTTKPQVIVQTKKLPETPSTPQESNHIFSLKENWIWKILVVVLLLTNVIVSFLNYSTSREHLRFTIMSNGGKENYQMLKDLYVSPAFQQASTLNIYELVERVNQVLASVQEEEEETIPSQQ